MSQFLAAVARPVCGRWEGICIQHAILVRFPYNHRACCLAVDARHGGERHSTRAALAEAGCVHAGAHLNSNQRGGSPHGYVGCCRPAGSLLSVLQCPACLSARDKWRSLHCILFAHNVTLLQRSLPSLWGHGPTGGCPSPLMNAWTACALAELAPPWPTACVSGLGPTKGSCGFGSLASTMHTFG